MRYFFDVWKRYGLDARINDVLRMMVREMAGRTADPSLVVLDSQSVRASAGVPKSTTGPDAVRKTPGRQRGLAADVIGLIVAASVHDNAIGTTLLNKVAATTSTVRTALADQGLKASVVDHGRTLGIDVQIVERNPACTGFVPEPVRWRVEQTNGLNMFEHEGRPLRARDLCPALDLPVMPKHVECTRAKLKRPVSPGFLDETEPGLLQQPSPQARTSPTGQRA